MKFQKPNTAQKWVLGIGVSVILACLLLSWHSLDAFPHRIYGVLAGGLPAVLAGLFTWWAFVEAGRK